MSPSALNKAFLSKTCTIFCLLLLGFLLLGMTPAQAQESNASWSIQPCMADGTLLPYIQPYGGYYNLFGPSTGYFGSSYPSIFNNYEGTPVSVVYTDANPYDNTEIWATASNSSDYCGWFHEYLDPSGNEAAAYCNGDVSADLTGKYVGYFKATWLGTGPSPGYIPMLITTSVWAQATLNYDDAWQGLTSFPSSGLSASASATDEFNETVVADGSGVNYPPSIIGYHLVHVAVNPQTGIAEVDLHMHFSASASNTVRWGVVSYPSPGSDADVTETNGNLATNAVGGVSGSVKLDDRDVTISSPDIETSYFKGQVDAQHPTGRWAHTRNADGSMSVDSGVVPNTGIASGNAYHADVTYNANAANFHATGLFGTSFLALEYSWTHPDGSSGEGEQYGPSITVHYDFASTSALFLNIPTKTTVRAGPDDDGATGTASYTVNWHLPNEGWTKNGSDYELPPIVYTSNNGPQAGNGFVHVVEPPNSIDYSIPSKVGGGLLAVGSALFAPELDPLVLAFLQGAGYSFSLTTAPTGNDLPLQGTPDQLKKDVDIQESITQTGSSSAAFMPSTSRMASTLADQIHSTGDYAGWVSGSHGPPNLVFNVTAYQHKWHQDYTGDGYDVHGYTGQASGYINWTGGYEYVYTWTLGQ
jgi:hypothetical protein